MRKFRKKMEISKKKIEYFAKNTEFLEIKVKF